MIPRKIHYFWAGPTQPQSVIDCVASWRRTNPEYELVRWNQGDIPQTNQVVALRKAEKWAALSSIARAFALRRYGGFYFDTDVELIKPLDPLRPHQAFVCTEASPLSLNDAASGSCAGGVYFDRMWESMKLIPADIAESELEFGPRNVTKVFCELTQTKTITPDFVEHVKVFPNITALPKRFFFPYNWNEKFTPDCIDPDQTFGIHHWTKMW